MLFRSGGRSFPAEEKKPGLAEPVIRSPGSVGVNFWKAYSREKYPAHFLSKIPDAGAENTETETWPRFAFGCTCFQEVALADFTGK